ncbi:hypothetical protein J2I47_21790 [Fibrella sp. HMF5335]|uniref:Uncharacterized protein n=1 Tax=Fibrella rubiginis TaxID=2817060 RepID=A0A939K6T7_9BACT|nr:hypothetical protein [Fibrella rubiginis]MBO0939203.1 hypothetical protein [Fibrella rubiginis]
MDLDKYRRTPATPTDPAPTLGSSGETLRQKANRYHDFVADNVPTESVPTTETTASTSSADQVSKTEIDAGESSSTKGNKYKSNKRPLPAPKRLTNQEPASLSGVKIVFIDEAMRKQYIQIAGYVMLNYGVKLTMTAYFCFLHEQAVAQQSDQTFLNALAQFTQPRP